VNVLFDVRRFSAFIDLNIFVSDTLMDRLLIETFRLLYTNASGDVCLFFHYWFFPCQWDSDSPFPKLLFPNRRTTDDGLPAGAVITRSKARNAATILTKSLVKNKSR
jgi:hypothetical protein